MNLLFLLSNALFCTSVGGSHLQWLPGGHRQKGLKVPGDNPLTYCADPSSYILDITYINLSPNPPVPGKNVTVTAGGTLSASVDAGTIHLTVKWNYVSLINKQYDLCESVDAVDLECPLEKGPLNITKIIEIPSNVPSGTYVVKAEVYTEDHDKDITCLEGSITF